MNRTRTAALLLALTAAPLGAADVELASRIPPRRAPETGGGASRSADLSADGRFVAFASEAANLVAGVTDRNQGVDVFLYDRVAGETVLVSRSAGPEPAAGDQESRDPAISADGRFVTFWSTATDLVPGQVDDGENRADVFLWDRLTGTTELVSHAAGSRTVTANGDSIQPVISADGRTVDVFVLDRTAGTTTLVSRAVDAPEAAGGIDPRLSADGRFLAFTSTATDLAFDPGGPAIENVYAYDRSTGETSLVSHSLFSPFGRSAGRSLFPLLAASGSAVVFTSEAPDLVPRDFNDRPDAFVAPLP